MKKNGTARQYTSLNYTTQLDIMGQDNWTYSTIGITYDEKDPYFGSLGQGNSTGKKYRLFNFIIKTLEEPGDEEGNSISVYMGKTDMYEITEPMAIKSITFPNGVPESFQINICSYSKEGGEE